MSCVFIFFLSLQSAPITTSTTVLDSQSAQQSQQLAKRLLAKMKQPNKRLSIRISQKEIHGLTALVHRAFPQVNANVHLSPLGGVFLSSITLPFPEFIKYLNIKVLVLPSTKGLDIEQIMVGDIAISGQWIISLVKWTVNTFIKQNVGDKLLDSISSVLVTADHLQINAQISQDLIALKNERSVLAKLRDELALFGDVKTIKYYFTHLNNFAEQQNKSVSIAVFVNNLFELAMLRCQASSIRLADVENQAALLALVIYFGADKFELMIGDLLSIPHHQLVVRNQLRLHATLRGRADLQQHFIYSIALQLFSSYGASDAIGEFKEFLDSNKGGSGFSFADLMADRAGTRLAMIATLTSTQALHVQNILSKIKDEQLLPQINGLAEGLSEQAFKESFGDANSAAYQQVLSQIDNRLKQLPIYQLDWSNE